MSSSLQVKGAAWGWETDLGARGTCLRYLGGHEQPGGQVARAQGALGCESTEMTAGLTQTRPGPSAQKTPHGHGAHGHSAVSHGGQALPRGTCILLRGRTARAERGTPSRQPWRLRATHGPPAAPPTLTSSFLNLSLQGVRWWPFWATKASCCGFTAAGSTLKPQ